jgi:hypothetical protein
MENLYCVESGGDGACAQLVRGWGDMKRAVHDLMCCAACPPGACISEGVQETVNSLDDDDHWTHFYPEYPRFHWSVDFEDGYIRVLNIGTQDRIRLSDAAIIAVKILRGMGTSNDTVYHAKPQQMKVICASILAMHRAGCRFSEEQISMMFEGEESEARAELGKFGGTYGWVTLNRVLNEIFEQPDDAGAGEEEGLCRAQHLTSAEGV